MRKGQNPAKFFKDVARPERITVALLSYIPFLSGYYAESLDVIKVSLESMRSDPGLPFDLMVFDNGSCQEVLDFLHQERAAGRIQYLILSDKNLGKGGAWNIIFGGAPGKIIAYTDSDVLFYPKWLSRSVELLETFPNVGMVTARPFRTPEKYLVQSIAWVKSDPEAVLEEGQLLPWEWFYEFSTTLGFSDEELREIYSSTRDFRVTYRGVKAFLGASHWQFVTYKSVIQKFLPFSMDRPMGQVRQLDESMNKQGFLRLMPIERYAQNMSNRLPPSLKGKEGISRKALVTSRWKVLFELRPIKWLIMRLYDAIFRIYYES